MSGNSNKEPKLSDRWIPLSAVPGGRAAVVRRLDGGRAFVGRLASLGFTLGVQVQMVRNGGRGPLITCVRNTRVALGRGEAMKIWVSQGASDAD
jgi:ferrous iron transport protein A